MVLESHDITNGWEGTVYNNTAAAHTAEMTPPAPDRSP